MSRVLASHSIFGCYDYSHNLETTQNKEVAHCFDLMRIKNLRACSIMLALQVHRQSFRDKPRPLGLVHQSLEALSARSLGSRCVSRLPRLDYISQHMLISVFDVSVPLLLH